MHVGIYALPFGMSLVFEIEYIHGLGEYKQTLVLMGLSPKYVQLVWAFKITIKPITN